MGGAATEAAIGADEGSHERVLPTEPRMRGCHVGVWWHAYARWCVKRRWRSEAGITMDRVPGDLDLWRASPTSAAVLL